MLRFMPTHPRETNLSTESGLRNSAQRRIPPREDWLLERAATRPRSLHDPAVAHDQGLPGEGVRLEGGEKQSRLRDVAKRGEFTVDRVLEHDGLDDGLLRDASFCACSGVCLSAGGGMRSRYAPGGEEHNAPK